MKMKHAVLAALLALVFAVSALAQSATADLRGVVRDPAGALVPNAAVTIKDESRGIERTATTNAAGEYQFLLVPPGRYTVTVNAAGFARLVGRDIALTVGQNAELPLTLQVATAAEEVTVSAAAELVETSRSAVANTIDSQRIDNLPINQRDAINFALTLSQVNRDNGRPIGPAPTSGLNIGGQRGRSTVVQVDGADFTDTSVNASRSTLSQEAVQEYQIITNSYAAEFGRAAGGVVNVVSKSGTNDFRGNMFGFLRHKSFQADNRFAPVEDPPYTRAQYGATLGGPVVRDRTFFFASFEQRRRQESGFFTTDVTRGLGSSVNIGGQDFPNLTAAQAGFINNLLLAGQTSAAVQYAFLASSGGSTALNGSNALVVFPGMCPSATQCLTPIPAGQQIGPRFLLSGMPVPLGTVNAAGQPIAFRPLTDLQTIFPVKEATTFSSLRLDHTFTENHRLSLRGSYNPSLITGIQVESQNQALGQNDVSRTGVQDVVDTSAVAGLSSTLSSRMVNEARYSFGQRRAQFYSQNGDAVAYNISGTAFIGRELFSPVQRTERRHQMSDTLSVIMGSHNMKFGADVNYIDVGAIFELNFAGLFNFGGLTADTFGFPASAPAFTPVQQYGLGMPSNYIQGFGNPRSGLSNWPLGFFAQDSWKIRPNLTLNYGVRYDVELTQQITPVGFQDPLTGLTLSPADIAAAQDAMGVQQGLPRDKNNFAPRLALAWDPFSDGKTAVRMAYGMFYDHPLQAVAFNSDIADAAQQQQFVALTGSPSPTALLNATQIFHGTVCVPGQPCPFGPIFTPGVAPGTNYQSGRQRFDDQTFPGFGPVLPFSLPISKDFQYAHANHANFTIERQITNDLSLSAGWLWVGGRHLHRPVDINAPDTSLLLQNFTRYAARNPNNSTEAFLAGPFTLPSGATACNGGPCTPGSTFTNPFTGQTWVNVIPGMIVVNPANGQRVISPAIANFFRPNGPNYFLAALGLMTGGIPPELAKAVIDAQLEGTVRTPGTLTPFGSMNTQTSNANSNYHALNIEMKKRFSSSYQFLASYTWSHAIDESSDLQTLLLPQDNRNLGAERANSLFDQRHRFVFSGIMTSPGGWRGGDGWQRFLADFTIAPILEISSGRPFNILSNVDTNLDQSNQTDRPNVTPDGRLVVPPLFTTGNLSRNAGITDFYASLDLRIARTIPLTERFRLEMIADGFNLFNKFNQAAASPFFSDAQAHGTRFRSTPTAAFDPRQFQFGLKLAW